MKALLDACVLYPTVTREVLLNVAAEGLFTPLWSPRILEEWARAARKIGPTGEPQARAEIALLRANWPRAQVTPKQSDLDRLYLPDPNDIHVLAAAIAGSAEVLVTFNAQDFPRQTLADEGIRREGPDQFLYDLWLAAPDTVQTAVGRVHAQANQMSDTPWDLRKLLKKARLPRLGKALG